MEARGYADFAGKLVRWFEENKRSFPWREIRNPYLVLIAEILLRKTDAATVSASYKNFISKYPNLRELATANLGELEEVLEPLGLHKTRAKELKKLAEMVIARHAGQVPRSREELLELPGVGDYIANAVLCFAYGESLPLLDTNIIRILERAFGVKSGRARPRTDKLLWETVKKITPKGRAREFNLAMLDLGALICTPKNPKCNTCPVANNCRASMGLLL